MAEANDQPVTPTSPPTGPGSSKGGLISWAFYDWANSAFTTVVVTFVFATYFAKSVAIDTVTGTTQWGYAISISGLTIAVMAPILGALADKSGRRKPWVGVFTAIAVVTTALLWFIEPDPSFVIWALILIAIGNFAFEMAFVFYNAMLPDLVSEDRFGRLSGWAWGLGYAGGLSCLVIILVGFDTSDLSQIRATSLLVAVWYAVFSIPFFLWTPDLPSSGRSTSVVVTEGLRTLASTIRHLRDYRDIARFLIARMIYNDGLITLFAFGGIYASGTFGMTFPEVLQFAVAINVTSGIGAALFGWIDDRIGPKRTILIALTALSILSGGLLMVETKTMFWVLGVPLGLFVGPVQAASRSLMAHRAPKELQTEMFGLYALSGKATAFLGPAVLAFTTDMFSSQRAGMATILIFFVIGGLLLLTVKPVKP
ncbi:MAG: MFS transporter [Proteobacteria bacterium]|nr:MFS transporter [Pseudomonadota bacterium]